MTSLPRLQHNSDDSDGGDRDEDSDEDAANIEEMNERDKLREYGGIRYRSCFFYRSFAGRARRKGIDPMDPAAYGDVPVLVFLIRHLHIYAFVSLVHRVFKCF